MVENGNAQLVTGGWGLSWCREKWWGSVLAVFSGTNPVVKVGHRSHLYMVVQLVITQLRATDRCIGSLTGCLVTFDPASSSYATHFHRMGTILWKIIPSYRHGRTRWSGPNMEGRTTRRRGTRQE